MEIGLEPRPFLYVRPALNEEFVEGGFAAWRRCDSVDPVQGPVEEPLSFVRQFGGRREDGPDGEKQNRVKGYAAKIGPVAAPSAPAAQTPPPAARAPQKAPGGAPWGR